MVGRWGGRSSPHIAKDGGPGSGPQEGGGRRGGGSEEEKEQKRKQATIKDLEKRIAYMKLASMGGFGSRAMSGHQRGMAGNENVLQQVAKEDLARYEAKLKALKGE